MKPVTCWYKETYNERVGGYSYQYNHFEMGCSDKDKPIAKFPSQKKNWNKANWKKMFAYLTEDNIIVGERK